jgi:hypothetical protein
VDKQLVREIAHHIIMSQTEDIEYLSVWEIAEDRVLNENPDLTVEELAEIVNQVDATIGKAEITITFKD